MFFCNLTVSRSKFNSSRTQKYTALKWVKFSIWDTVKNSPQTEHMVAHTCNLSTWKAGIPWRGSSSRSSLAVEWVQGWPWPCLRKNSNSNNSSIDRPTSCHAHAAPGLGLVRCVLPQAASALLFVATSQILAFPGLWLCQILPSLSPCAFFLCSPPSSYSDKKVNTTEWGGKK